MNMRNLLQALVLVLAAVACAFVSNLFAGPERRLAWFRPPSAAVREGGAARLTPPPRSQPALPAPAATEKSFPPHPDKPFVEISGDDASQLFARSTVFFDARRSSVYRDGHIAGARSFPVWEADIDDRVRALVGEGLDPSTPLVVYCSGGDCEDSHMLAQKLYLAGFDDVLVYKDGFPDWEKRGLPAHKGEKP